MNKRERVIEILVSLGLPTKKKGFDYLTDVICFALDEPKLIYGSVIKVLYPRVAEMYGTKVHNVNSNIHFAIGKAWDADTEESKRLHELFGNTISYERGKPSNVEFIALIVDRILHEK